MSARWLSLLAIILAARMAREAAGPLPPPIRATTATAASGSRWADDRVRRQVFRRAGHLHRQPRADGDLCAGGEQDVLRLRRGEAGQTLSVGHGLVLRSRRAAWCRGRRSSTTSRASTTRTTIPACASTRRAISGCSSAAAAKVRPGFIYRSAAAVQHRRVRTGRRAGDHLPAAALDRGQGFLHLFTKYTKGRELYWSTSPDGRTWTPDQKFAGMGGHYQTSHQRGQRVITAFNMHPGGNVDKRTNLYFLQTDDLGRTWRNAHGEAVPCR